MRKKLFWIIGIVCCFMLIFFCLGISRKSNSTKEYQSANAFDDNVRTYYEIFVYSFYDSDGDGIGDLQGVISKLDYLNDGNPDTDDDLGITGIWLMPIMPSTTYHKYDVTNFCGIDSEYGTIEDFEELIKACHKRGIRVIIDFPINHTSSEHEWFQQAKEYLESLQNGEEPDASVCPYVDYYNFTRDEKGGYVRLGDTDWYYEAQFWSEMPDLNLHCVALRNEIETITDFWISKGIDGYRLDAVKEYVSGDTKENIQILSWLNQYAKSKKDNFYFVCECWTDENTYAEYYLSGVDSMFDFQFADKDGIISKVINGTTRASVYANTLEAEQDLFTKNNPNYINAPFYSNHDMGRSAGYYKGDYSSAQTKMGHALNLFSSGNAFLYYGEELGMKGAGKDENKRAPMYWSKDSGAFGMCIGPADMEAVKMKFGSLEEQEADESSIYQYVKRLIQARNQYAVLQRGNTYALPEFAEDRLCGIKKVLEDEEIYVLFNCGEDGIQIDLRQTNLPTKLHLIDSFIALSKADGKKADALLGGVSDEKPEDLYEVKYKNGILTIPGYSVVLFGE